MKAVFEVWANIKVSHLNRILRPFNVRLVLKRSKEWGDRVTITAQPIDTAALAPPRVGHGEEGVE